MNRNSQCPQVGKWPEYVFWEIPKLIVVQIPNKEAIRISRTRFISSIDNPQQRSIFDFKASQNIPVQSFHHKHHVILSLQ